MVLADGCVVECDEHRHDDLFWALRGAGGGQFGVVTSLTFTTVPAPTATSFHFVWPYAHAAAIVESWQDWAPAAPDELAASLLMKVPGDVELPPTVNVFGAMAGTESDMAQLLGELTGRTGAEAISAVQRHTSYRETKRYLAELGDQLEEASQGEPSQDGHPFSKSEFFRRRLPPEAIAALVQNLADERIPGHARELDFTPWGGAYNRVSEAATAFVHRHELFLLKHGLVLADASSAGEAGARGWLNRSWGLVHPWGSGGVYPNFPDLDLEDSGRAYYGTNYDRLVRVKRRYDPDGCFGFQQSLPSRLQGRGAAAS